MLFPKTWCGLVAIWFILLPPAMAADSAPVDIPLVDENLRHLVQARDWDGASAAIAKALQGDAAPKDHLLYLQGRVLHFQGKYDAAITTFQKLEKQYPNSTMVRKARFAAAASLVKQQNFERAELIYRAEAEQLLSEGRRQEFAEIYLEFADAYYEPEDDDQKPNYAKALSFYDKAIDAGPKPDRRLEVELRAAHCRRMLGMLPEAAARYTAFIDAHADSPLAVEARYRLGEVHLAGKDRVQARRTWEDLLALEGELPEKWIAETSFHISRTWGIPKPATEAQLNLGVNALQRFLVRFPDHSKAAEAHVDIAESYVARKRFPEAVEQLQKLLGNPKFAESKETPRARQLLGQALLMQERYEDALTTWRDFLVKHPSDSAWSDVQRKVIDAEYVVAAAKTEAEDYEAARRLWLEFLAKYPLDKRGPEILFLVGQIDVFEKKWDAAIAQWRTLVSKFPKSDEASHAQYEIGVVTEEKLGKLPEALKEYRKVTWGEHVGAAKIAVARLTSKSMSVVTERTFRTDETPKLKLTTRNIRAVTVRAYKVNLESYFRKMHRTAGVELLDIALIDPDVDFEFTINNFQEYEQLENRIEIALPDKSTCGAMAVTVSSDTLEATTLVLQSDLDVIVKASRDELFVFAENMLTQTPWPNARLLISDGRSVLAEATTNDDGVFHKSYKQLAGVSDVRVLAVSDQHVASNAVGLQGIGVAQGLADKAYLYTDRPAYRAGESVQVRGCVRQVLNGAYAVEEGKVFLLDVIDPRGRIFWQEQISLGPFGTFQTGFALPGTSPQGTYRLQIREAESNRTYAGTFVVHATKLEPVRLAVDVDRFVYCRGEQITGKIRAEYYFGAPLANREIVYQLAYGRSYTATTNEEGEVEFELPTREFYEKQLLRFLVKLPRWNVQTSVNFQIATQGFTAELATSRDVFIAGEPFELSITTKDAAGKSVGRQLNVRVLRLTTVEGKVGEVPVESHAVRTDDADGVARLSLQIDKGGQYRLRAEGEDQWGNPVSSHTDLLISGEEDQARLRILADQHTYRTGDKAEITLHWRERPALALVTFQAERVLDYQLVPLQTGENKLPITMNVALAPNFSLDVAVMTLSRSDLPPNTNQTAADGESPPKRLHTASSPFTVVRNLNVTIARQDAAPDDSPVVPGQPIEVTVTTTDPQGKPVAAEVSLAMVEQSLLDRFKWPLPPIQEYFRAARREPAVRTSSSIEFVYRPNTSRIHPLLLTEQQRIEQARDELKQYPGYGTAPTPSKTRAMRGYGAGFGGGFGGAKAPANPFGAQQGRTSGEGRPQSPFVTSVVPVVDPSDPFADPSSKRKPMQAAPPSPEEPSALGPVVPLTAAPDTTETAYWNPSIITDESGTATVKIAVPDRSTAWKLIAKGITTNTLAGETAEELTARKNLFGQLKLPAALMDGDEAEIIAQVVNNTAFAGKAQVLLQTVIDNRTVEDTKEIEIASDGITEVPFNVSLERPANGAESLEAGADRVVYITLTVVANDMRDVLKRGVPLRPYGVTTHAVVGGSSDASTSAWLELPEGPFLAPSMQILVGPSIERSLLDTVLPSGRSRFGTTGLGGTSTESISSDLMAALGLQQLFAGASDALAPQAPELDARIRFAIGALTSAQRDDGGWAWSASGSQSDRYASARATWALAMAKRAGYQVADDCRTKSLQFVQAQIVTTSNNDLESKAMLLHALCVAGETNFSLANRLHRDRHSLSAPALLYLSLALMEIDRQQMASELLKLVESRLGDAGTTQMKPASPPLACNQSLVEVAALHALVIQAISPRETRAKELVDWLLSQRRGHRWAPDKATGPATMAICQWFAKSRFQAERYQLQVRVNDRVAGTLDMAGATPTQVVNVPGAWLVDGKQKIGFELEGRGQFTYQVIVSGFVPAGDLKSSAKVWRIERSYTPAQLERDGKLVPRGFKIVSDQNREFRNPLTQLTTGDRALVELTIERTASLNVPDEYLEYLVVTESIPSGTTIEEQSVHGAFERFEIAPGQITFYVGPVRRVGTIHYELHGYLPGKYKATPAVARNVYRPDEIAVSKAKALQVLPAGVKSDDEYRLSPQELLELGGRAFRRGEWQEAERLLSDLLNNWSLTPVHYRRTIELLLDTSLELGRPEEIVRYFEIVFEKWPDTEIPFSKVLKIAAAYHELGEFERSYLAFRASVEGAFARESGVAGILSAEGELLQSIEVMHQLIGEYPPEPYVAAAHYSLAQLVYAKAPQAKSDPKLIEAEISSSDLTTTAWRMLEEFLTDYPLDPASDQAAFSAANALLELKDYAGAAEACERYASTFTTSELLDSFWFMVGYCRFAMGQHDDASEVLTKVAKTPVKNPFARDNEESTNKWPAIYILGQIEHSRGNVKEAIRNYRLVEDRYPDARKSIGYFLRKTILLPDVTRIRPGDPVKVTLAFRNIETCNLKVYRIDLMKFALLRQNVGDISRVNLAGIEPSHEASLELGNGQDYQVRTKDMLLDVEEEGAYLIVCRGGSFFASGFVLVSPLEMDVLHSQTDREVRVTVKDVVTDQYVHEANVKVVGVGNAEIISGETDRRGLFVAEGIVGGQTVVAESKGGRYAFYRDHGAMLAGAADDAASRVAIPTLAAPRILAAQDMARESGRSAGVVIGGPGSSVADQKIDAALDTMTFLSFKEAPLKDVARLIQQQHRITVQIDRRSLDDVGLGDDTPITFEAQAMSLRSALKTMLKELDLCFLSRNEALLITTPEEAENMLTTVIYPVTDLVRFRDSEGKPWSDYDTLINTIQSTVATDTWDEVGGAGAIEGMRYRATDVLVIAQTQELHRHITSLLETLRRVAKSDGSGDELPRKDKSEVQHFDAGYGGYGMGGGMGGMGGMGGGFGAGGAAKAPVPKPQGRVMMQQVPSQSPTLLKGLEATKRRLQGQQADELERIYQKGKGGMGGGVGAGGFF